MLLGMVAHSSLLPSPSSFPSGREYMFVLHSLWDTETFYIWAESSAQPLSFSGGSGNHNLHCEKTTNLKNRLYWAHTQSRLWAMRQALPSILSWNCPPIRPRARLMPTPCPSGRSLSSFPWKLHPENSFCPLSKKTEPSGKR